MKNLGKIIAGALVVVLAGTGILMASQNNSASATNTNVGSGNETAKRLTKEEALEIALDHAGLNSFEVEEMERDNDDSRPVIEIEFRSGSMEYEYTIDAYTGQILEFETERRRDVTPRSTSTTAASDEDLITKEEALAIALEAAELSEEDIRDLENEFEKEDGVPSYEIEFNTVDSEYEFDIDAKTGEILEFEKDLEDMLKSGNSIVKTEPQDNRLSKEEALAKALAQAEVEEDSIRDLEYDLDEDDNRLHYDIEFASGLFEYEYDVDAYTGDIITSEKDRDDDYIKSEREKAIAKAKADAKAKRIEEEAQASKTTVAQTTTTTTQAPTTTTTTAKPTTTTTAKPTTQATTAKPTTQATTAKPSTQATTARPTTQATTAKPTTKATTARPTTAKPTSDRISKEQAINIALKHAGVNRSSARFDDVELDSDDGYLIWEIEFEVGNYEYEYDINARNGSIIEWEREYDD